MKQILLVDDELLILKALKRILSNTDFHVIAFESGKEALMFLENQSVDMLITDIRMPEMDGIQFLEIVKHRYPDIIRLVLSGYSDEKTIYRLFEQNLAKMCIYKPWNNDELLNIINQVFETNNALNSNCVLQVIKKIDNLPVLNNIYNELCILVDSNASISEIEHLLMKDQAIIADILRIANSAYMNIKTGSIRKAISYIGLKYIKDIVLVASLPKLQGIDKLNKHIYELFYNHSMLTNKLCCLIYSNFLAKEIPQDSSCIGLLHEVGRIILMNNFPDEYTKIIKLASVDKRHLYQIETDIFGVGHQIMSSYLLNWWGFPFNLVDAILNHHSPLSNHVINKELASVLYLADYSAARILSFPWVNIIDDAIYDYLDINKTTFEKAIADENLICI